MKSIALSFLAGLLLALTGTAQTNCSTLAATTVLDPVRPSETVTLALSGSLPNAPVTLAFGQNLGQTTVKLPSLGAFVLELDRPFSTKYIGVADSSGNLTRSFVAPSNLGLTINAQAVGMQITPNKGGRPKASFCTSNVASFDI